MQRARAFGMHIHAFDPVLTDGAAAALGVEKMDSLVALASAVDVLTVHVGLNEHTRGMIDAEVLGALAPGSIFINTSRGEIVNETALAAAVLERGIRAGLDVFCDEPKSDGAWHTELAALDGVYGTHHIGASTAEASDAVGGAVIEIVETWIETGTVLNCVNLALGRHASHLLVVRHKDEVGVLAGVLNALSEADINVQEMDNTVFRGAKAACAHIQLDAHPGEGLLKSLGTHPSVFAVDLVDLEET
jgi:D-3-phosphoglycerate dehydrogenase